MNNLIDSIQTLLWSILLLTLVTYLVAFQYTCDLKTQQRKAQQLQTELIEQQPQAGNVMTKEVSLGRALFKSNCATCHHKNMKSNATGPALRNVTARWQDYPITDLYKWVQNAPLMIEQGHPKAVSIWKEWDKKTMNPFPHLTDSDVIAILEYIKKV